MKARLLKGTYPLVDDLEWEAVYREYLPRIYNFLRYRVNDESLAEDLTAVTFEKAWRGRFLYRRNLSAYSTWLFTIARNVAIGEARRKHPVVSLDAEQQSGDSTSLEEAVQRDQDFHQLRALMSELSLRERDLIALKYGAELTNREIAVLTGLSESNVGTILNRIVEKLRTQWKVES